MTEKQAAGTSGGGAGTSGPSVGALTALLLAAMLLVGILRITGNVYSFIAERHAAGYEVAPTFAWLLEGTSLAAWILAMTPCWFTVRAIRPPRFGIPATVLIHAMIAIPVSLAHIALMTAFRLAVGWALGDSYSFAAPAGEGVLYEFRKDISTYAELLFILFLVQWLVARYAAAPATLIERRVLAVGDGAVTHHLPVAEIEHVAAAGNYVEIAWRGQRLLHRATLSAIEKELADADFVRIHRSRLVCRTDVRRVVTHKSGDFVVEMESGETLRGSRRFRENVEG